MATIDFKYCDGLRFIQLGRETLATEHIPSALARYAKMNKRRILAIDENGIIIAETEPEWDCDGCCRATPVESLRKESFWGRLLCPKCAGEVA